MALTITLLQMRTAARQRADMENSLFCSDAEINQLINANIRKIHRRIAKSYGNQYIGTSTDVVTVSGTQVYALPAGFMKLSSYGVWWIVANGQNIRLSRYNPNESMAQNASQGWSYFPYGTNRSNIRYDIFNKQIRFLPTPISTGLTVRVHYLPIPTALSADGDTYDGIIGFEEGIIWSVAADMLAKQESDASYQIRMAEEEFKDLLEYADPDQNEPAHVQWVDECYEYE